MVTKFIDGSACPLGIQSLCFTSSLTVGDWAAWAQAIGSVAAIFTAIGVVLWQLISEARRRKEDEIQQLRVLWMLVYHCRVEMQYANAAFNAPGAFSFVEPHGLRHKVEALRAIPVLDMPDSDAAIAVLTAVEAYDAFVGGTAAPEELAARSAEIFISQSNAALENFIFAESRLRLTLRDRGSDIEIERTYSINGQSFPPLEAR